MSKNKELLIDDHKFEYVENGVYKAKEPYTVNISNWMFDDRHKGYQAIVNSDSELFYISISGEGNLRLIDMFNEMRRKDSTVEYIEGVPSDSAMGEIYA